MVELRDAESKSVSWALVDLALNKVLWQESTPATDWWTMLTGFAGNRVFLHNYRFPELPEPTDLLALSAAEGELQWALPGWLFVRELAHSGQIIVAQKQPESIQYRLCNAELGLLKDTVLEQDLPKAVVPNYRTPVRYEPPDVHFGVLSSFLGKIAGVTTPNVIDYLESDPYLVFSYYLYEQKKTAQYLLVADRSKEIIYHNQLSDNRPGLSQDTIILAGDYLVFLRSTNELISLKLARPE